MIDLLRMAQDFESQPGRYPRLSEFHVGSRVMAHPATDTWMRGDRYGTVATVGRELVHVTMDVSGRVLKFHPDNLVIVE